MIPKDLIIVIGRQYGSGGRNLGRKLAERLSLEYFDKELLHKAAGEMGFSPEIFSHADEKKPSLFNKLFLSSYGISDSYNSDPLSGEGIYMAQSKVIRSLGEKGGCVIVGRTADHILRHKPNLISIFLHSSDDWRAQNICNRGETDSKRRALEIAQKRDHQRESYYNYFTGRKWGAAANYDLTINSSSLSSEALVDVVVKVIENRFK